VRFTAADRSLDLEFDYELAFAAVRGKLEQVLGLDAIGLKLAWHGAETDDEMTVSDLLPSEVTVIRPKVELREVNAELLIAIIPRTEKVKTRPADTLAMIEPTLRKCWELEDLEIEFVIGDSLLEDWRVVSRSTPIEKIDLENLTIGVAELQKNRDAPNHRYSLFMSPRLASLHSIVLPQNIEFSDGSAFIDVNLDLISFESGNSTFALDL
jgi:hypothetical protein